ncbi:lipopolysaccharide biosynthesis protein [Nitratiruptor tergarcus]|uniref:Membrane protein involved in the export of O-antigen and teichoic acid n=1 Tax=Nitratiruptor tergarcus DSM 16512 TaxID=1069081 RepID=A0A1W1WTY8_9BACT|nr:oligosaccharide flippase family protein [Nitratiruptor tergarcus]SMC09500.1 Membrane protein involved in the export of O-antigen and teichoic acid [Nitratiruptor tergarcus DSM 16512]
MDRNRNIFRQIKWSFLFKILTFIFYYISISFQVKILGSELYGVWATLLSIVTWVVFFDFGLGNGIKNYLTEALSLNNTIEAKEIIMTGYVSITIISILLFLFVYIFSSFANLQSIFNTTLLMQDQLKIIVVLLFGFVFLHFIISFVKQFIFAIQKNALNEFEQFLFYILLCSLLLYLYVFGYHSIESIVIVYGVALITSKLVLTIIFFTKNRHLIPSMKNFQKNIMGKLMNVGISFFALQMVFIFIMLSDKIIITQLLGPKYVTSYDIVYRLFSIVQVLHGIVNAPLWSAYTEAYTKKEIYWIISSLKKMGLFVFVLAGVAITLNVFSEQLISIWIGDQIQISKSLVMMMTIYVVIVAWNNNYAFFLNAINAIKVQFYTLLIGAILNIPLSIFFVKNFHMGNAGVVLATILSLSFFAIAGPIQARVILSKVKNNEAHI